MLISICHIGSSFPDLHKSAYVELGKIVNSGGRGAAVTADDILNGFMKVEIGMAVVRPAEFIILSFSHKLVGTQ